VTDRVALFSTRFLPYSQTFVYEEIRHHERYAVEVFCRSRLLSERFPFEPVHRGGPLYAITCRSPRFEARFRSQGFALVHAHFGPGAVYARPFARRHRLPLVVTFHGYDVGLLGSRARFLPTNLRYALLGPRVLRDMTLGLCASTELRAMLEARGVPAERLRVHRLGVDLQRFRPGARPADRFRVAMIGRLVEKKGFEYGLEAFARAARTRPALELTLAGDGERRSALERQAAGLGVAGRVRFTGPLPPGAVAELLATSHVLLAPSVVDRHGNRESGLIVVKEASACAAVPVGTRHGGIPEIIDDGRTGFLVAERDVDGMAARLGQLADEPALRQRLGAAAREKMLAEYDVRARGRALEQFYDEARELARSRA
jgi:glycosyltransferase involved in cell wall biosynthesis